MVIASAVQWVLEYDTDSAVVSLDINDTRLYSQQTTNEIQEAFIFAVLLCFHCYAY